MKLLMADYHRNGVMGDGFVTGLFKDDDGTTKLFVDFGEDRFAVLDVAKVARGTDNHNEVFAACRQLDYQSCERQDYGASKACSIIAQVAFESARHLINP